MWCLTVLLAAVEVAGRSCRRCLGHSGTRCFAFFFLSLPPLFFFLFCFSPSFSFLFSLLCSVFFFFFSFGLPPFFLVFLFSCALPYIYRKNRGERGRVGHCAAAPKIARGARSLFFTAPCRPRVRGYTHGVMVGVFLMFFGERGREKLVKKSSSSPVSHV